MLSHNTERARESKSRDFVFSISKLYFSPRVKKEKEKEETLFMIKCQVVLAAEH